MKRSQRRAHLVYWAVVTPAMIAVLWAALGDRQVDPVNPELPAALVVESN